jgi:hypothetical protein
MTRAGRWTPDFRAWVQAYVFDGLEDSVRLDELERAASEAGEKERWRAQHAERCSECGRPIIEPVALLDLLALLDGERPVAA